MRFKTDVEAVILAVLADGPRHGYGIAKTIRTKSEGLLKLGEGQLYPMLRALEEAGWIVGEWDPNAGEQPRRLYALSDSGRAELEHRSRSWHLFVEAVDQFLPVRGKSAEVV
jgi:DNA-binding PadR family transcriptional regulator